MTGLPPADRTGTGNMVSVRDANLIMLITFALYMAYEFLLRYMPFLNDRTVPRIITGQILLVLPGLIYLIAGHIRIRNFMEIKEPSGFSLKMAFCALICAYPVVIILNLFSMRHVVNRVIDILPDVLKLGLLPSMLILALLPACVEEFLFRGIMYHSYRQVSRRGGIVLSALLFGLMHLNLNQMPYAFFLGLVLASMVEATGSIETSIFMHFLFNLNSVVINYFAYLKADQIAGMKEAADSAALLKLSGADKAEGIFMAALMIFFLFLIMRRTCRKNGRPLSGPEGGRGPLGLFDLYILIYIAAAFAVTIKSTHFI